VTRVTIGFAEPVATPRVILVAGSLSTAQLRDLERPVISQALAMRAEPALVWANDSSQLFVAPLAPLVPGAIYSVGVSAPSLAVAFTVDPSDALPILARRWPMAPEASSRAAVWCGASPLPFVDALSPLQPEGLRGRLTLGSGPGVSAPQCVMWAALDDTLATSQLAPALAPPSVLFADGSRVLLEPVRLWLGADAGAAEVVPCRVAEVPFGPGCAEVQDDRIIVRPPQRPLLWTVDHGDGALVRATRAQPFVLRPMPPDGHYAIATLDEDGGLTSCDLTVVPAPPRPHVILNEVLANPLGTERAQEWVELFNDGQDAASLAGYALETGSGSVLLPSVVLAPGQFALVAPEGYVADNGVDRPPWPGTTVLRVPALGRDGLSNEGERLALRDATGALLSTFPAMKSKSGVSNVRVAPEALDLDPDSFAASPNESATPGAPNGAP
jgi:hypothetical protein